MGYNLNNELGYIYDAILYFSLRSEKWNEIPDEVLEIEIQLGDLGIKMEEYMIPFYYSSNKPSWFSTLFKQNKGDLTLQKMNTILSNRQYLTNSFLMYFFPKASASPSKKKLLKNPTQRQVLEIIQEEVKNPEIELYLYYILLHLKDSLDILYQIFLSVFEIVKKIHSNYLSEKNSFIDALKKKDITDKLSAIVGTKPYKLNCALSLLDPKCISHNIMDTETLILGKDFTKRVNTEYKYCNVTLYSLVVSIGNSVKYGIFKIFLQHNPVALSIANIEKEYPISRNAIYYNVKEMIHIGIIKFDHAQGQSYFYKLDMDFIQCIIEQLVAICK